MEHLSFAFSVRIWNRSRTSCKKDMFWQDVKLWHSPCKTKRRIQAPCPGMVYIKKATSLGGFKSMACEVVMPKWGLTMKSGKIARWLVEEGAAVTAGMPLLEVETDKITNVVEAPCDGVLVEIVEEAGATVPVMEVIARIGEAGEAAAPRAAAQGEAAPAAAAAPVAASAREVRAMPAARRLAKELGVDLTLVTGTGRDGIVMERDVREQAGKAAQAPEQKAAPAAQPAAAPADKAAPAEGYDLVPMEGMRKIIADNMHASLQNAAQLTVFVECDVTDMVAMREQALARHAGEEGYRLSYNDIIAYAVCRALKLHPIMNSTLHEDGIHLHHHVNLGIAVSLDNGLIVPNVKDADTYSLEELKKRVRDVAGRARKGGLSMDEITGGSFTISNVSMLGVDGFTPVLNPPETAILGVGRVQDKPAVHEGTICVRKLMTLSLTFNHMVTDGGPAMNFLRCLADMLERPVLMLA